MKFHVPRSVDEKRHENDDRGQPAASTTTNNNSPSSASLRKTYAPPPPVPRLSDLVSAFPSQMMPAESKLNHHTHSHQQQQRHGLPPPPPPQQQQQQQQQQQENTRTMMMTMSGNDLKYPQSETLPSYRTLLSTPTEHRYDESHGCDNSSSTYHCNRGGIVVVGKAQTQHVDAAGVRLRQLEEGSDEQSTRRRRRSSSPPLASSSGASLSSAFSLSPSLCASPAGVAKSPQQGNPPDANNLLNGNNSKRLRVDTVIVHTAREEGHQRGGDTTQEKSQDGWRHVPIQHMRPASSTHPQQQTTTNNNKSNNNFLNSPLPSAGKGDMILGGSSSSGMTSSSMSSSRIAVNKNDPSCVSGARRVVDCDIRAGSGGAIFEQKQQQLQHPSPQQRYVATGASPPQRSQMRYVSPSIPSTSFSSVTSLPAAASGTRPASRSFSSGSPVAVAAGPASSSASFLKHPSMISGVAISTAIPKMLPVMHQQHSSSSSSPPSSSGRPSPLPTMGEEKKKYTAPSSVATFTTTTNRVVDVNVATTTVPTIKKSYIIPILPPQQTPVSTTGRIPILPPKPIDASPTILQGGSGGSSFMTLRERGPGEAIHVVGSNNQIKGPSSASYISPSSSSGVTTTPCSSSCTLTPSSLSQGTTSFITLQPPKKLLAHTVLVPAGVAGAAGARGGAGAAGSVYIGRTGEAAISEALRRVQQASSKAPTTEPSSIMSLLGRRLVEQHTERSQVVTSAVVDASKAVPPPSNDRQRSVSTPPRARPSTTLVSQRCSVVMDTSSLIHAAVLNLNLTELIERQQHWICIPFMVVEELDKLSKLHKGRSGEEDDHHSHDDQQQQQQHRSKDSKNVSPHMMRKHARTIRNWIAEMLEWVEQRRMDQHQSRMLSSRKDDRRRGSSNSSNSTSEGSRRHAAQKRGRDDDDDNDEKQPPSAEAFGGLRVQSKFEVDHDFDAKVKVNDDSILGYAVYLRNSPHQSEQRPVVFVTEDKMLRIKAHAESIPVLGADHLMSIGQGGFDFK